MTADNKTTSRGETKRQLLSAGATLAVGILVVLLVKPSKSEPQSVRDADVEQTAPAKVTAHGTLFVARDTPLASKLSVEPVSIERLSLPLLSSTGAVVARLAVGAGAVYPAPATRPTTQPQAATTRAALEMPAWDFGSPDLFSNYTDWIKSQDDVRFNQEEVAKIRVLNTAKMDDLQKTADRLAALVKAGSDAPKDLQAAESALLQGRLQAEKDLFEAEQALRVAKKAQGTLERQLIAADVAPDLLANATEGTVVVAADVPESRVPLIHIGAACTARFYGLPGVTFSGKVGRIGSVLVKDRRTLRVLFVIQDPENRLHSNMFAEVGLGTDARDATVVPVDSLVHDGVSDYVLVATPADTYRATIVLAGDPVGQDGVEILSGLNSGDRIISAGTILLKPYVVKSLEEVK